MDINTQDFDNFDTIQVLIRKKNGWYINDTDFNIPMIDFEDIESFLAQHNDFVQINLDTIVNLNYINEELSNISKDFLVLAGKIYIITTRYLKKTKSAFRKNILLKNSKEIPNFKGKYLKNNNIIQLDTKNIRFLVREGSLTKITYQDGTQRSFYQTLKYFDKLLSNEHTFIRVRRDCIINTAYLNHYQINKKNKTGEISIESNVFSISRRNLQSFKKIIPYIKLM
ncbi:LytTR family transcriptional regulator DNA-binding domain-containing protein [Emticicia sp. SJ17W-69]|uniref:LytTR family transcriptional regulator DNA-binding domain-containing protein n=1 Tax=Emticicia sp. SJ17W-69 TaxID=3421657 RepID=UPI003EBCB65E